MSIRTNSFNSGTIFSGGTTPRSPSSVNPGIWAGRATVQSATSIAVAHSEHGSTTPSITDVFQNREGGGGMRVGKDFQARIPACCEHDRKAELLQYDLERALLVWCPTDKLTDADINGYIKVASEKFTYSREQALGLLYWHGYDIPKALEDLGNFTPHPEEWSIEDKIQFEQAFQFHGKAFDRIRQMLPDKSMSSLIRYYYKWKKSRNKSSAIDRHSKRISQNTSTAEVLSSTARSSSSAVQHSSTNPNYSLNVISQRQPAAHLSDSDDDIIKKQNGECSGGSCGNCGVPCTELSGDDNLCNTCYLYWKKTGKFRPLTGPMKRGDKQVPGHLRQKRIPPRGMYINHDDLTILAAAPPQAENIVVQGLEKDLLDSKSSIQSMKQQVDLLKRRLPATCVIDEVKPMLDASASPSKLTARWTHDELLIAAQGVRLYGKDFKKVVEVLPSKSETHIKSFYVNYRRRFGLDDLIKEQELEMMGDELSNL